MIILKSQDSAQDVFFISRNDDFDKISITSESELTTQDFIVSPMFIDYYGSASISPILKEGFSYIMKVYNGDKVVYYDTIYCTNQSVLDYDFNDGQYTEQSNPENNDFIVIE